MGATGITKRLQVLTAAALQQAGVAMGRAYTDCFEWVEANTPEAELRPFLRMLVERGYLAPSDPSVIRVCGGDVTLRPDDEAAARVVEARIPPELAMRYAASARVWDALYSLERGR